MSTTSFEADEVFDDKRRDDSSAGLISLKTTRFQTTSTKTLAIIIVQFVVIILLGASLGILAWRFSASPPCLSTCPGPASLDIGIVSPAQEGIRYQSKTLYTHVPRNGPYLGDPTPEINAAWANLTRPSYIKVTKQELDAAGVSSMEMPEYGHFTTLNVYHHLHCLRAIKRYVYAAYYHPGVPLNEVRTQALGEHIDHCVDYIRETIMCQPDFSMATFGWEGTKSNRVVQTGETTHTCVDWDVFHQWTAGRALDVQDVLNYWAAASASEQKFEDS